MFILDSATLYLDEFNLKLRFVFDIADLSSNIIGEFKTS